MCVCMYYLFIFRERCREGQGEEEKHQWGEKHRAFAASPMGPDWEPNLKPRHVPSLGIEPVTFHFAE